MGRFESLLNFRLKPKTEQQAKITALAELSQKGELSSFSGLFHSSPLSESEKENLSNLLKEFQSSEEYDVSHDLKALLAITSEVKAITNQAVMLHGERIKKAQTLLKTYKEGAFSAWLISTYGNRQTPYNFLQYYEFYSSMPSDLHPILDEMPRQAIYTLASRAGENERKQLIVKEYKGETKQEVLQRIRQEFPLDRDDKRLPNLANQSIQSLKRLKDLVAHDLFDPTEQQHALIVDLLKEIGSIVKGL
ncbi:MAG: CT583 family protein [Parachlamydiales bacterium]|jgi:hypothetical protein